MSFGPQIARQMVSPVAFFNMHKKSFISDQLMRHIPANLIGTTDFADNYSSL